MTDLCPHCHRPMPVVAESGLHTKIIDFISLKSGRKYRVGGANSRMINARLQEGHTFSDFEAVITYMAQKWMADSKMQKYVRPSTLFRASHFGEYLAEAEQYEQECKGRASVKVPPRAEQVQKPLTNDENLARLQALKKQIGG